MARARLQKILAAAGFGSRRACEIFLAEGRVTVDGVTVRELGAQADPDTQDIRCDGRSARAEAKHSWLLYKPVGHVCTSADPQGRPRAIDLLPAAAGRVYTVGRLDANSEGLILLTNDGDFAHRVMHPRHEVSKTYHVCIAGRVSPESLRALERDGVWLDGRPARADRVALLRPTPHGAWIEIVLHEGRNREVRRMVSALGLGVQRLIRVRIGGLSDPRLKPGEYRPLREGERERIFETVSPSGRGTSRAGPRDPRRGV